MGGEIIEYENTMGSYLHRSYNYFSVKSRLNIDKLQKSNGSTKVYSFDLKQHRPFPIASIFADSEAERAKLLEFSIFKS